MEEYKNVSTFSYSFCKGSRLSCLHPRVFTWVGNEIALKCPVGWQALPYLPVETGRAGGTFLVLFNRMANNLYYTSR